MRTKLTFQIFLSWISIGLYGQMNPNGPVYYNAQNFYLSNQQGIEAGQTSKFFQASNQIVLNPGFNSEISGNNNNRMVLEILPSIEPAIGSFPSATELINNVYSNFEYSSENDVGTLEGNFSVDESGNASYYCPIYLASGTNGMQPEIGISYNSASGEGLLGFGWNLNAISVIYREGKTLEHEGLIRGYDFTNEDNFSLDGERLIESDPGFFDTYNRSFYRIKKEGGTESNPAKFIIYTKDGKTMEYGATPESKLINSNSYTLKWFLTKVSDQFGNTIVYNYVFNSLINCNMLSSIDYTKNSALGIEPNNKILFEYAEKRNATHKFYPNTEMLYLDNLLLSKIKVLQNNQVQNSYDFRYYFDGTRTKLVGIQKTFKDGSKLNPTIFNYSNITNKFKKGFHNFLSVSFKQNNATYNSDAVLNMNPKDKVISGDFNGDGKTDIVYSDVTFEGDIELSQRGNPQRILNEDTQLTSNTNFGITTGTINHKAVLNVHNTIDNQQTTGVLSSHHPLLFYKRSDSPILEGGFACAGIGFSFTNSILATMDYNKDRIDDFITFDIASTAASISEEISTISCTFKLKLFRNNLASLNTLSSSSFVWESPTITIGGANTLDLLPSILPGDFNGDGNQDFVAVFNGGIYLYFKGDGVGSFSTNSGNFINLSFNANPQQIGVVVTNLTTIAINKLTFQVGDFDGDGVNDILSSRRNILDNSFDVKIVNFKDNTINSIHNFIFTPGETIFYQKLVNGLKSRLPLIGDFNGDGISDIYFTGSTKALIFYKGAYKEAYIPNFNGMVKSEISYNSPDQFPENNTLDIELMDFNGDGLSDIFMVQNKHVNPAFPEITTFFYRAHLYLNLSTSLVGDDQIAINVAKPFSNPEDHFLGYRTYMSIFSGGNNISNPEPFSKCFTLKGDFSGYGKNEFLLFPFSGHLFSGTTLHTFNFEGKDHLLSSIRDGQSNETIINFKNLNNNQPSTQFFEIFNYPPSNIEDNVLSFSYNELNNQTIFSPGITQNGIPSNNTFSSLRSGFVVSSVSEKNSSCPSGNCFEKYTYQRPIFNAANGAFVGFGKTIKRSLDNYKTVVEKVFNFQNITYGQYVFPRVFLKEKTTKTYPSESTLFLESKDINNCVVQNGKYLILPSSSTNTNHFDNVNKEITYTVDQTYGNITTSTATVKEAGVVLQTEITNKVFSIGNYTNWHKNNITKNTKTLQRQGEEAFIEETDFIYNNLDQLDTKTQFASSNPIVSNYTYFAAGVLKKQTVNYANEILENSEILEYNPQYIYPTKTKNNAGWISSKLIDTFYGKTIKETDINGLESNFEYNSAGYLIKSISPTGVNTHYSYEWIELNGNELGAHKNNTWETNPNNSTAGYKTIIKDEKNRVILQGSLILGGNLNFVAKTYNQKNQLFKESIPMIGNANNFIDPYTSAGSYTFKVMSYNNKNELIGISNDVVNGNVAISREPLKEIITNTSTSRTTTKNFDGLGNVKSIIDPMGSVVTYNYTSTGKLKTITAEGATTTNSYHPQLDYLQSTNHPNKGLTEFLEFDKKFRPKKKKDANNNIEEYTYDNLDRITKTKYTAGNANGSSYEIINTYDLQSNNKGKISRIASEKQTENFVYDGFSNLVSHTSLIPGEEPALNQYSYDIFGREVERIFPDGIVQRTIYNLGFVEHILVNSSTVWRAGQLNRWGKYKNYFGGSQSQQTVFTYDDSRYDLYLTGINNSGFRNSSYNFQSYTGNLLDRNDEINQQHERFTYDNLDRLLTVSKIVNEEPILQKTFTFASNGNIETKSDVGQYEYGSKPHAITDVKNFAEPFPVSLHTQTIEYNEMLMPKKINENEGQYELEIFYGNAPQRVKSTLKHDGQLQKTILYYGDYEIEKTINEPQRNLHYIIAPTGIAAIIEKKENLNYPIIYNTFTDYLGSLTHIVESGTLVDEISYDAWGRKRNPANIEEYEEDMETQPSHIFSRGYTFHEHLNEFKLINMNARLYDPTLGRMLSPDNFVTDASNCQDYNSYSYARNNPLKFTDPTGNVVQSNPSWGNDGASSNELGGANVYGYFSSLEAREERAFGMHILILVSQLEEELNERNQAEQANNNQVTNNQVNSINETISGEASTETGTKVPNETGGEVDYSNRAAKEFMSKYLGLFDFVANLFADYSTPEGYTLTDGGKVFLGPDGEKGWGATIKNTNATTSNIFFAEGAFDSKEKLYLVMGHEIIHAASNYLGLDNGDFQEYAARQWAYKQAKEWNSSSLDGWRKNFEEIKFIRNLNGNNSPLLRPYIKSGVKIKSKYPW